MAGKVRTHALTFIFVSVLLGMLALGIGYIVTRHAPEMYDAVPPLAELEVSQT